MSGILKRENLPIYDSKVQLGAKIAWHDTLAIFLQEGY